MTQKIIESDKSISELLQTIEPKGIADESMRHTVEILLNLIEQLQLKVKGLESENQRLKDENNRLKGEQGQPDIKAKSKKGFENKHSSEQERKTPKQHSKSSKNQAIKIDREKILEYPQDKLPADAQFKGYEEVIVQDIILTTDNVLFRKEKYYSPLEKKTYLAELPRGLRRRIRSRNKNLNYQLVLRGEHDPRQVVRILRGYRNFHVSGVFI